jgi:heptosyltransferase III
MLTLPITGILKKYFPDVKIIFLAKSYTLPVLKCCSHIDEIANWSDFEIQSTEAQTEFLKSFKADCFLHVFPNKQIAKIAKKAKIRWRIGTGHRWFHFFNCNAKTWFSRKKSNLHEAQLNAKMLQKFGIINIPSIAELSGFSGFSNPYQLPNWINLDTSKKNVIVHPKSKGSAVEWGIKNFNELIDLLSKANYNVFITGTIAERELIKDEIDLSTTNTVDLLGKLSLEELIALIDNCEALVASSTGPLHISSALGKRAIGIYSIRRPIHPGRWAPIGERAISATYLGISADNHISDDLDVTKISAKNIFERITFQ